MYRWLWIFILAGPAHGEVMVRVKSHIVAPPHSNVQLSQLLDLHGISEAFQAEVAAVALTVAPNPGERIELSESAVTSLLRGAVAAEKKRSPVAVRVVVPNKIIVDTVKRSIDQQMVQDELLQVWKPLCSDCEIEIRNLSLPKVDNIVDWSLKLKAELPKGSFAVPVDITREGASSLQAWISGHAMIKRRVPVAKKLIRPGERLGLQDIGIAAVDVTYTSDASPTVGELVGKALRQGVRVSDPIWRSYIEKEKALRRGETVRVISAEGIWEVSTNALSDQDAYIGDTVSLKNPRTNKTLTGVVTGQGEVELR